MNTKALQLVLRKMRGLLIRPHIWVLLAAATLLLGFTGPFDTLGLLPLLARTAYWLVIVTSTMITGTFVFFASSFWQDSVPKWVRVILCSLFNGLFATLILLLLNWVSIGTSPFQLAYSLTMAAYSVGVSLAIYAVVISWVPTTIVNELAQPNRAPKSGKPALLRRLGLDKRGALISLTVQDHYVEVTTDKGNELVLMRLSDAIKETSPVDGLQIHRSHWVALDQIVNAQRQGDRATVTLHDGRDLPVSRTHLKRLRELDLLPT